MNNATKDAFNSINEIHCLARLKQCCIIRIQQTLAKKWLLENKSVVIFATVRYLQIKNLGLGVCSVALAPLGTNETLVVKEFISA